MTQLRTGWETERRTHFDEIVSAYDQSRPEYPALLIEDIRTYTGSGPNPRALEIGPGTGKATAPMLAAGFDITGVEIGENMAAFLRERFAAAPRFRVIIAAFEDAPLEEDAYDLVYAASVFHWIKPDIGCPKARRLLRPGGALALLRYNMITDQDSPLYKRIQDIYDKYYRRHYPASRRPEERTHAQLRTRESLRVGYGFADMTDYGFRDVTLQLREVIHNYTAKEYIGFLDTLADHRALPEADRQATYAEIGEAIEAHGGRYEMRLVFRGYFGRK